MQHWPPAPHPRQQASGCYDEASCWWVSGEPTYGLDLALVRALLASPHRTDDPARADLFVVPAAATARLYRDHGYRASLRSGVDVDDIDNTILHRFASFHLDRIDLSPLTLDDGETIDIMEVFRTVRERAVRT